MKSLITKRQLLFVILVLLCGINPIYADTSKELYVNCGNLSDLLPERERFKITDLTLSGSLDVSDLEVIRQMGRCHKSGDSRYNGHLRYLDLSDAEFVGDGTFKIYLGGYSFTMSQFNGGSGGYLFSDMESLHTIKLPNSMEIMGNSLFDGCENLTSVTLPKSLKTLSDWTLISSFEENDNLTSILIDDSNPYYSSDGSALFDKYKTKMIFAVKSLRKYAIPSSVSEIIQEAFYNCTGLTFIYAFMEKPCEIKETSFDNETKINATLYVPKGSLLDYWDDNEWKKFMNIEEFDATSIGSLNTNANDVQEVSRYSDNGQRLNTPAKGLNIVKYNNGTVKKIMVK